MLRATVERQRREGEKETQNRRHIFSLSFLNFSVPITLLSFFISLFPLFPLTLLFLWGFLGVRREMGCGNSSPANTNSSSSHGGTAGPAESSSKGSEESAPEDDKWKNYGGVYVGFPADMSNIPQVQIGSLRESERDSSSLRKPLWGNGL